MRYGIIRECHGSRSLRLNALVSYSEGAGLSAVRSGYADVGGISTFNWRASCPYIFCVFLLHATQPRTSDEYPASIDAASRLLARISSSGSSEDPINVHPCRGTPPPFFPHTHSHPPRDVAH